MTGSPERLSGGILRRRTVSATQIARRPSKPCAHGIARKGFDRWYCPAVKQFDSRMHLGRQLNGGSAGNHATFQKEQFYGQSRRTRQRKEETQEGRGQKQRATATGGVQARRASTDAYPCTCNSAKIERTPPVLG